MKKLVIAEKPSVAKDLARVLGAKQASKYYFEGDDYIITWALGHLLTLRMPEDLDKSWQKWEMNPLPMLPSKIGIKPLPKTRGQLKAIGELAKRKDISGIVIATDAGREGELVARWIIEWIRFNKKIERLWISSQTDRAIKAGFAKLEPAQNYQRLYDSALARSQADWYIGLNVTRALTVKYNDSLSAGRVQTPTLQLVRQKEAKIASFRAQTFYEPKLIVQGKEGKYQGNPFKSQVEVESLIKQITEKGQVEISETQLKTESAPLPYDLTELQRVANEKYGFSAKKTLSLVQTLYEFHKIVSYPRTDSKYLPSDLRAELKEHLLALRQVIDLREIIKSGAKVIQQAVFNDSKVSDHYALIPTEKAPNLAKLSNDEHKIYFLIVNRFVGLFLPKFKKEVQKITVTFPEATFIFHQEKILEAGFKQEQQIEKSIDWHQIKQIAPQFSIKQTTTTPPNPLSEGKLLQQMEKYGLGTPATRAEIIEKIISSGYVDRNKFLTTTPKGRQLLDLVNPDLKTPETTAKWEIRLERIAQGKEKPEQFVTDIKAKATALIAEIKSSDIEYKDFSLTTKICPKCGANLKEKATKNGKLLICSNLECDYKRQAEAKISNHRCPQCHRKMLIIDGSNGKYFKCKYDGTTEKLTGGKAGSKKVDKRETQKIMKKLEKAAELESPLAAALKNLKI
ncbi:MULTISPECIES: DNA topoisomerase 3 [unclassified Enterococcus]|uniref:DNA topoisomerase 3 n=1 Tax=unclassified Enterococcus TaxID=2608891 RepID=UPI001556656D|nr:MULTISPECIES: DNA topoisomerase 3 [unclassified Enterococcus]MBS7576913.1 DNA topoisomerase 3 [Enterococcus sp. MMGLQ5-2]MBS7584320.1 DNA topoisomerase 3 [Enterococcus sp. MMGLQ5-1]NPD12176.1 DNA topoisomerase 3 [Enterococcus sp. MMGLQ5-1]NPD36748.1 DNA topoisomerase 3 [Enterococcus sp. MMGLQ5-2]